MKTSGNIPQRTTGEISVGPMSSQGTLRLKLSEKSALFVSARAAYMNLLYGSFLEIAGNVMKYNFQDYNLTSLFTPDKKNRFHINFYYEGYDVK